MAKDVLQIARELMCRRKFSQAIKMLESREEIYQGNFDYYLLYGICCLYLNDTGAASTYFQRARNINLTDTTLLLGQAAIFLRRGQIQRALPYYMDILENDPENKVALDAMEFLRTSADQSVICRMVDTGEIEQFYPPLGVNPMVVAGVVFPVLACVLGILLVIRFVPFEKPGNGQRADLSSLVLSVTERKNLQEVDLASGAFSYILSSSQINDAYDKALSYFQQYRDNLSQIEINRILNSNASVAVKQKANVLMGYLDSPSFDTIKDVPAFYSVEEEPALYLDCWVAWSGRISNVVQSENLYECDLLVGYEKMEKVEGIVPLKFTVLPVIETEKPVTVLARISSENGKMILLGKAVYQSVKN